MNLASLARKCLTSAGMCALITEVGAVEAVTSSDLNMRVGPGIEYAVVDMLHSGEVVSVGRCENGWCRVQHQALGGWVAARYLTKVQTQSDSAQTVPTPSPADSAATSAALSTIVGIGAAIIGSALGQGAVIARQPTYAPSPVQGNPGGLLGLSMPGANGQSYLDTMVDNSSARYLDTLPCDPTAREQFFNRMEAQGYSASFLRGKVPSHCQ